MFLLLIFAALCASGLSIRKILPVHFLSRTKDFYIWNQSLCLVNQRGSIHIFMYITLFEWTPQLWRVPTPSLYLWELGGVQASFLKEKDPSQEWESGIATAVTSMGQCLLCLVHFCKGQSGNGANTLLLCCVRLVAFSSALGTFGQKWPVALPEQCMRWSCLTMSV